MGLKQKRIFDAGVKSTVTIPNTVEYLEPTQIEIKTPRSQYAIHETTNLPFTNHIVGDISKNLNIADGQRRPGTK